MVVHRLSSMIYSLKKAVYRQVCVFFQLQIRINELK